MNIKEYLKSIYGIIPDDDIIVKADLLSDLFEFLDDIYSDRYYEDDIALSRKAESFIEDLRKLFNQHLLKGVK